MKLFVLLAALDVIVFGGWIAHNEVKRRGGVEVRLPVEGYDPRDLLSGHYVRFRLKAERQAKDLGLQDETAFCLKENDHGLHDVYGGRRVYKDCPLFLSDLKIDRFYVDEARQNEVVRFDAGNDTYLVARIDASGGVHPVDLVVAGKSMSK